MEGGGMKLEIRPVTRKMHREAVSRWHSHHRPTIGEVLALGGFVNGEIVAVVVMGVPVACALDDGVTWEVSRLAVGPDAPKFTASRLLGAAGRAMDAVGVTLGVSYTRVDESGGCYRAANWTPVGYVKADTHTHGNRATWLPGIHAHMASTDPIDRVRWERGPRAPSRLPDVAWSEAQWVRIVDAKSEAA